MPATSPKMQRFMGMCAHAEHPPENCPSRTVAREFSRKPAGGYSKAMKKSTKGSPSFTEAELAQGYRKC